MLRISQAASMRPGLPEINTAPRNQLGGGVTARMAPVNPIFQWSISRVFYQNSCTKAYV